MARAEKNTEILLVDDDEEVLMALEASLENEGYNTTTAWSGQEALNLLRSRAFDLVLLDDYLPDVASEEILQQLQRMPHRIPVILMQTAVLTDESAARRVRLGACYFVNKRKPAEISGSVRECLPPLKIIAPSALGSP